MQKKLYLRVETCFASTDRRSTPFFLVITQLSSGSQTFSCRDALSKNF